MFVISDMERSDGKNVRATDGLLGQQESCAEIRVPGCVSDLPDNEIRQGFKQNRHVRAADDLAVSFFVLDAVDVEADVVIAGGP